MVKPAASSEARQESSMEEPKYKGVRKRKWGKWVSEIRLPNSRERIWLGSYDSPEKAARAFDAAAFCLRGTCAKFNFPDQPPNIPGGTSLSPLEIQAAAARFANSHHSHPHDSSLESPSVSVSDAAVPMETHTSASASTSTSIPVPDNVPDYGIFPGFDDDYFMGHLPMVFPGIPDYDEENPSDGDISQDPSFLWNFN